MPRLHHVKKARKDNPVAKKGESYYWWKFRFGPKRYSKERPPRSALTQSNFLSQLYDIQDSLGKMEGITENEAEEIKDELLTLQEECECSLENMPYHLQDTSDSGTLLQERIDGLEGWINDIESVDWDGMTPQEALDYIVGCDPGF